MYFVFCPVAKSHRKEGCEGVNILLWFKKDGSGSFVLVQPSSTLPFPVAAESRAKREAALVAHVFTLESWREIKGR